MPSSQQIADAITGLALKIATVNDNFSDADKIPVTITYSGSWPLRTTATTRTTRRVIWIGNPGGSPPVDMETNDLWTQGE